MTAPWIYAIASVLLVSLVSLIGVATMSVSQQRLKGLTFILVSLAAGAMLGNAFIHLIPEAFETATNKLTVSLCVLGGIFAFFVMEKFLLWRHCHEVDDQVSGDDRDHPQTEHVHPVGFMSLAADGMENMIDGMMIGAAYLVSVPIGIATTIAVILHEIPTEMGDFGVLLHAGFSRGKALLLNFLSGLVAVVGALLALFAGSYIQGFPALMAPIAAGCLIYIAGSDLVPQLHKELKPSKSAVQLVAMVVGVGLMLLLKFLD